MEELIRQAFLHVEGLGPHVAEGHYDLIGPNGEIILPRVWETTIEPDWSVSMHMWPMPEPPKHGHPGMPGPPPGHHFREHGGRPHSQRHPGHRGGPGPGMPTSQMRGGPGPPPPPPGWAGGPPLRPPSGREAPGGAPVIVNLTRGPPKERRSGSNKRDTKGGVLAWMAGDKKGGRSAGKGKPQSSPLPKEIQTLTSAGTKKAEPEACVVM
jgi:hypothetical protein